MLILLSPPLIFSLHQGRRLTRKPPRTDAEHRLSFDIVLVHGRVLEVTRTHRPADKAEVAALRGVNAIAVENRRILLPVHLGTPVGVASHDGNGPPVNVPNTVVKMTHKSIKIPMPRMAQP
jgi:hypothetical protein